MPKYFDVCFACVRPIDKFFFIFCSNCIRRVCELRCPKKMNVQSGWPYPWNTNILDSQKSEKKVREPGSNTLIIYVFDRKNMASFGLKLVIVCSLCLRTKVAKNMNVHSSGYTWNELFGGQKLEGIENQGSPEYPWELFDKENKWA